LKKSIERRAEEEQSTNEEVDEYVNMLEDEYLDGVLDEKERQRIHGLLARQKLFLRKAAFNKGRLTYWFTWTYDSALWSSPEVWQESIKRFIANNCDRKGIKIMGGFEYGDENERLHFHGIGIIPEKFFNGKLHKVQRYSDKEKRWKTSLEFSTMREKYGINEFESVKEKSNHDYNAVLHYICDYIVKQGGKMYYSRGLKDHALQFVDADYLYYQFEDGEVKYNLCDKFRIGEDSLSLRWRKAYKKYPFPCEQLKMEVS
jgi:hypothetical protein